jgi:hypothetical protein
LSALRPTFGRVSRYGGMVLAWSQDRVGPMCRTIEDVAMVFHIIHGVDVKDPATVTTPFQFDRNIRLASLRIGTDAQAPPELLAKLKELGATFKPIGARPSTQGGGFGAESAAFFDAYVRAKAAELGIDLATLGRGGGGGGRAGAADTTAGRGAAAPAAGAAGAPPDTAAGRGRGGGRGGSPIPFPGAGGRNGTALDFIQAQRRRHIVIRQWQEFLKDFDMYIPTAGGDIGAHAQTGHPSAVVQYKFEPQPQGRGGGGGRGRGADTTGRAAAPPAPPPAPFNPQPICAQIVGNLYNDDMILSVAHQFQVNTDFHTRRPKI